MATDPPTRRPPSVLFVEDEPRLREILSTAITSWGFAVATARSGEEAVKLMNEQPRDIALLDLNLPGMSGIEFFEQIRQRWPGTAVVILTGFGDLQAAKAAIRLDVVDFLTKPCRLDDLETALDRAWKRSPASQLPIVPPTTTVDDDDPDAPPKTLEEIERKHILETLARHKGNRTTAAAELGISRRTLQYRLSEYQEKGWIEGE
jgi:DNA-binding NtrC family response regulator